MIRQTGDRGRKTGRVRRLAEGQDLAQPNRLYPSGPAGDLLIPRVVDSDLFHRREIRHRAGAVRAVVGVPQGGRDAPGDEFLSAFGAPSRATRRVAPLARYGLYRVARRFWRVTRSDT